MPGAVRLACAVALAMLAVGTAAAAPPQAAAPQAAAPQRDWTQIVEATAEGGFRMGNPDAPVKLVQYTSLTCPHCARFEKEGGQALRDYVAAGGISWEVRTFLLFSTDTGASLLLHCRGAADFFPLAEALYAAQPEWSGRVEALSPERLLKIESLPLAESVAAWVEAAGLDAFFRERGMPTEQLRACLADPAGLKKLADLTHRGVDEGVTGTPAFLINGELAEDAYDWQTLEPRLKAAMRRGDVGRMVDAPGLEPGTR
jgi:protein-disulfide isomerase